MRAQVQYAWPPLSVPYNGHTSASPSSGLAECALPCESREPSVEPTGPQQQHDGRGVHAAGNPVNALGQAIAQQQFNALVDVMGYEELYEFFGGGLLPALRPRWLFGLFGVWCRMRLPMLLRLPVGGA